MSLPIHFIEIPTDLLQLLYYKNQVSKPDQKLKISLFLLSLQGWKIRKKTFVLATNSNSSERVGKEFFQVVCGINIWSLIWKIFSGLTRFFPLQLFQTITNRINQFDFFTTHYCTLLEGGGSESRFESCCDSSFFSYENSEGWLLLFDHCVYWLHTCFQEWANQFLREICNLIILRIIQEKLIILVDSNKHNLESYKKQNLMGIKFITKLT